MSVKVNLKERVLPVDVTGNSAVVVVVGYSDVVVGKAGVVVVGYSDVVVVVG